MAGSDALSYDAAATVFIASILAWIKGPIFWCLRWRDLFAPTLDLADLHPNRVIHVEAGRNTNVLPAMEECLRHQSSASKRLQLAAES